MQSEVDILFLNRAIALAKKAAEIDEVPVGAVLTHNGEILAEGYNMRETDKMATHHAELVCIEEGCRRLGGWRLPNCTLYVTLEPCPMCAGAIMNARIGRVVFGARDPKAGAYGSLFDLAALPVNHKPEVVGGVLEDECRALLSDYFKGKRKNKEIKKPGC